MSRVKFDVRKPLFTVSGSQVLFASTDGLWIHGLLNSGHATWNARTGEFHGANAPKWQLAEQEGVTT